MIMLATKSFIVSSLHRFTVITMRKFIDGSPFLSHMSMGFRLAVLRAAGAPLSPAVDVMMERAKRIYILIIKVNKLFLFFITVFSKRNRKHVLRVSIDLWKQVIPQYCTAQPYCARFLRH